MQHDKPADAAQWLERAKGDSALSKVDLPAEKAIKAVYIKNGWVFRYVHDIEELLTGLKNQGLEIPNEIAESVILTSYASEARYPGVSEPVKKDDYLQAVQFAPRPSSVQAREPRITAAGLNTCITPIIRVKSLLYM